MAEPEFMVKNTRDDATARALQRIRDIVPCDLDYQQRERLADVLTKVWDDGYGHGRDDEADGQPTEAPSDEDRTRDAMAEAQEHPGRVVTR